MAVVFLTRVISLSWLQCTCMYIHVHYSTKLQDVYLKVEYGTSPCIRDNGVIAALITEGNYDPVHSLDHIPTYIKTIQAILEDILKV